MPQSSTIQTRKQQGTAVIRPNSYNPETRELTVDFGTGKPVSRYSWTNDERYLEVLEISERAADLERVNIGAAVVKNHNTYDFDKIVGVTTKGWVENGKLVANIKLSGKQELEGFRKDVEEGIVRNISFGYIVHAYERSQVDKKQIPQYTATRYEVLEISFVTVPADPGAGVRDSRSEAPAENEQIYQTTIIDREMSDVAEGAKVTDAPQPENRSVAPPVTPVAAPPVVQADPNVSKAAATAERQRIASIEQAVRMAGFEDSYAKELIDNETPLEQARNLIQAKWVDKDPNKAVRSEHTASVTRDAADNSLLLRSTGLALRSGQVDASKLDAKLVSEANQYREHSLLNMARMSLEAGGLRGLSGYSDLEIVRLITGEHERAITQSTSDFANMLGGIVHQVLAAPRGILADTWRKTAHIMDVTDFRPHKFLRTWGIGNLAEVPENAEYTNSPIPDGVGETIAAKTFGKIINLSRQAIINDELGAFTRGAANLNRAWYRTIETKYYELFALNTNFGPTMADGLPLFDAAHGNIQTAANMDTTKLDAMRQILGIQKDEGGIDYLDLKPSILLTSLTWEAIARRYNEAVYDVDVTTKNGLTPSLSAGLFDEVVGTPRLPLVNSFYTFADPDVEPTFAVAFLRGKQTPTITRHEPFRVDGFEWKISGDFGVGAVGYKGAVLNKGA